MIVSAHDTAVVVLSYNGKSWHEKFLPGIVAGPRIEGVIRARAAQLGVSYAEMERQYLEKVSLRRMVTPQEVAAMVTFLVSPLGRAVSGQSLGVCGNVEAL